MTIREVGINYPFKYTDIKCHSSDWVDNRKFRPLAFDLVSIRAIRNQDEIIYNGWWTGSAWEAIKKLNDDKVVSWRRKMEES